MERIYQKKSQLEHILLRPDTYIGSVEPVKEVMWVSDTGMTQREITFVSGFYKIFDEILVNGMWCCWCGASLASTIFRFVFVAN